MMPKLIKGASHFDERGSLDYINDLDLSRVKRFYKIKPASTDVIRAWQIHRIESKWFHCVKGSFEIQVVNLKSKKKKTYILHESDIEILYIPKNYANGFKALVEDSCLQVFSDKTLEESKDDGETIDVNSFDVVW